MIDWLIHPSIHPSIHSFIHPLKTKSVSWFAVCSLFICCLLVLYVIWYNLYMLVCVCVCVRACVCNFPFIIFCMLFIYMYISSIWRNKSWNQNLRKYRHQKNDTCTQESSAFIDIRQSSQTLCDMCVLCVYGGGGGAEITCSLILWSVVTVVRRSFIQKHGIQIVLWRFLLYFENRFSLGNIKIFLSQFYFTNRS